MCTTALCPPPIVCGVSAESVCQWVLSAGPGHGRWVSGLAVSAFTYRAISLLPDESLKNDSQFKDELSVSSRYNFQQKGIIIYF